jgi:hypothetical protein
MIAALFLWSTLVGQIGAPTQKAVEQQSVAPAGWGCRIAEDLGFGVRLELNQSVIAPGQGLARDVELAVQPQTSQLPSQSMRWLLVGEENDLSQPWALSLRVPLKKRDLKGSITARP